MLEKPSMTLRIAIGKTIGFAFGLAGFLLLPQMLPGVDPLIRWGILLWYTTLGAIIAVFGVYTWHPVLRVPLPWWVRAPLIGGWMNFVLAFFAYGVMSDLLKAMFGDSGFLQSPFWFVLEGALVGLVIGYFATRFGGEGAATVDHRAT